MIKTIRYEVLEIACGLRNEISLTPSPDLDHASVGSDLWFVYNRSPLGLRLFWYYHAKNGGNVYGKLVYGQNDSDFGKSYQYCRSCRTDDIYLCLAPCEKNYPDHSNDYTLAWHWLWQPCSMRCVFTIYLREVVSL